MPLQAIVYPRLEAVEIVETPIPTPGPNEVVIRVSVASANPKDWKFYKWDEWITTGKIPAQVAAEIPHCSDAHNSGDDVSGVIYSVGEGVHEFKPGDKVAAMHEVAKENGAYGEYAVAPAYLTFHVPHHVPFEEAATVPTSGLTTALALFSDLRFPPPWASQSDREKWQRVPFLIYGVTTSVGAFAAQLARLVGFQVIIGVAGRAQAFASALVDHAIDYRNGEDALVNQVEAILKKEGLGSKVPYIFDAISENGSLETCLRIIAPDGWISTMLPPQIFALDPENFKYPARVTSINTAVPQVFSTHKDFAYLWLRYFGKLMENGRFKGHPHQVVPGGLDGVLTGLESLRDGKASGFKYVFKIQETSFSNGATIYRSNSSL